MSEEKKVNVTNEEEIKVEKAKAIEIKPKAKFGEVELDEANTYKVMAGQFKTEEEALDLAKELKEKGIETNTLSYYEGGQLSYHRVLVENFETKTDAKEMLGKLTDQGLEASLIGYK